MSAGVCVWYLAPKEDRAHMHKRTHTYIHMHTQKLLHRASKAGSAGEEIKFF